MSTLDDLRKILQEPLGEAYVSTGRVLTLPSGVTTEVAAQTIASMDLTQILKDIGSVAAMQIAQDLEAMALRPADYALLPNLAEMVAQRIAKELAKVPTEFTSALVERMKLRG